MAIFVLNSPILTAYGEYRYEKIEEEQARRLLLSTEFTSAIGHEATANFLSKKLGVKILTNRIPISMDKNDQAVVFRLLDRLPEGKVLDNNEMQSVRYELGLLKRVK